MARAIALADEGETSVEPCGTSSRCAGRAKLLTQRARQELRAVSESLDELKDYELPFAFVEVSRIPSQTSARETDFRARRSRGFWLRSTRSYK